MIYASFFYYSFVNFQISNLFTYIYLRQAFYIAPHPNFKEHFLYRKSKTLYQFYKMLYIFLNTININIYQSSHNSCSQLTYEAVFFICYKTFYLQMKHSWVKVSQMGYKIWNQIQIISLVLMNICSDIFNFYLKKIMHSILITHMD